MTAPGSLAVGESGDFAIDLKDVSEFDVYDVEEVQIIKHAGVGSAMTTQVAATILPTLDGQTQFLWQWKPTDEDVGDHTFAAFVVSKQSAATPFEIETNSNKSVRRQK